ncbi:MAG: hypothetical protein IKP22_00465 [Clostridia bacterium]|nr:hypothetical protein [Clostridia bacterium]
MAYYSVCSINIETDCLLSNSFRPFLLPDGKRPERIDMTVRQAEKPYSTQGLRKTADLPDMTVFEEDGPDGRVFRRIFALKIRIGMISADSEYRNVEYCFLDEFSFLGKDWIGNLFSQFFYLVIRCRMILNGFVVLHSACVELRGKAYAFTGPSGIGKSSRASKWCELFSADWISGDRPAIRVCDAMAYGVPWDGKEAIYRNTSFPLAVILKVSRSESAQIKDLSDTDKLQLLCEQTFLPLWDAKLAAQGIALLKRLSVRIPVYEICCDITDDSIKKAKTDLFQKLSNR